MTCDVALGETSPIPFSEPYSKAKASTAFSLREGWLVSKVLGKTSTWALFLRSFYSLGGLALSHIHYGFLTMPKGRMWFKLSICPQRCLSLNELRLDHLHHDLSKVVLGWSLFMDHRCPRVLAFLSTCSQNTLPLSPHEVDIFWLDQSAYLPLISWKEKLNFHSNFDFHLYIGKNQPYSQLRVNLDRL